MAADDKVVIGQTHGVDDPEAVLIGYLLGVEALAPLTYPAVGGSPQPSQPMGWGRDHKPRELKVRSRLRRRLGL
jgi:hypothetical protein